MSSKPLKLGPYTATVISETAGPRGPETTWEIRRDGTRVGKMFRRHRRHGDRVRCSMRELVWSGRIPRDCGSPKSPHYGMHFDTGPHDTPEQALGDFARRANRLIAWREENGQ